MELRFGGKFHVAVDAFVVALSFAEACDVQNDEASAETELPPQVHALPRPVIGPSREMAVAVSDDDTGAYPQQPIYNYGIVMEVAHPDELPRNVVVFCFADGTWQMLHMIHDKFEILNGE